MAKVDIPQPSSLEEIECLALPSVSVHPGTEEASALDEGRYALFLLTSGRVRV